MTIKVRHSMIFTMTGYFRISL